VKLVFCFRRFRKTTKSVYKFCLSVRLSFRMEQLGSYWTEFYGTWPVSTFLKSSQKIPVSHEKRTLYIKTWIFMITSRLILVRMRNITDKLVEIIKTRTLLSITFFLNMWHLFVLHFIIACLCRCLTLGCLPRKCNMAYLTGNMLYITYCNDAFSTVCTHGIQAHGHMHSEFLRIFNLLAPEFGI
jgi:hypothetical protein